MNILQAKKYYVLVYVVYKSVYIIIKMSEECLFKGIGIAKKLLNTMRKRKKKHNKTVLLAGSKLIT